MIESLRGMLIESRICGTVFAYTINYVCALPPMFRHVGNRVYIVLQIGINTDSCIGVVGSKFQSCPKRVLVSSIMGQAEATYEGRFLLKLGNQLPSGIATPIVHEKDGGYDLPLIFVANTL